jgi:hypothetical protein
MPVLGYLPRFVKPKTEHHYRQDAAEFFYPDDRLPYQPGRQSRAIETERLSLFVHPREEFAVDHNFERACLDLRDRYADVRSRKRYSTKLACELIVTSASGKSTPGPELKAMGYKTKCDAILGCEVLIKGVIVKLPSVCEPGGWLDERLNRYDAGLYNWSAWGASLKDELVKELKYDYGDTRLFAGSPLDHLVQSIKVWGPVFDKLYDNWKSHWCVAGCSPKGGSWPKMLSRFDYCVKILNCDFKWFDTSQRAPYFRCIGEFLSWATYDDPSCDILIEEALNAPLVTSNGDVLKKEDGMPSGAFITLVANCLLDEALILAAHYDACGLEHSHLVAAIMGDDNCVGVRDGCHVTRETMIASHGSRGFILKDCVEHKDLSDVRFCGLVYNKTGFHPREDKLICSLIYPRVSKTTTPDDYLSTIEQIRNELVYSSRVEEVESWFYKEAARIGKVSALPSRDRAKQIWTGSEQQFVRRRVNEGCLLALDACESVSTAA